MSALLKGKEYRACVQTGLREAGRTPDTALGTDFVGYALACAENLPQRDAEAARMREIGTARLREILAKPDAPLAADDRSDALANLAEVLDVSGKHPEAVAAMQERAQALDKAAAAAPDATLASTFDAHRVDTWLYLKQPAEAEAAVDRALAKMDRGQRRVGVLGLKAKILRAEGKSTAAVLREQLDVLRSLPRTQRRPDQEAEIERKLGTASR